jgi:PAS domain S-box-containing protein
MQQGIAIHGKITNRGGDSDFPVFLVDQNSGENISQRLECPGGDALQSFIETYPEPVIVSASDGTLLQLNAAALNLLQAAVPMEVLGHQMLTFVVPEDHGQFRRWHQAVLSGQPGKLEYSLIGLKGARRAVETHAVVISKLPSLPCLMVAITRDIISSEEADVASRRLSAIVESSEDAIISKNLEGIIQTWNAAAERIFGYKAEEMIGQPVLGLIPRERWEEATTILSQIRNGQRVEHFETVRRRKDGTLLDISLTVSPVLDRQGRVIGASKIARDITTRKRAHDELRAAKEELARLNTQLEQRVQERTASLTRSVAQMEEYSYAVSHDLRAPVRAMKGYAEIVLDEFGQNLDEEAKDYLERIIRGGERMDRLIQDVLAYSRLNQPELQLVSLDPGRLVSDILQQYPQMGASGAEVIIRAPLLKVRAHEPTLCQALSNLLTNAVKFMAAGEAPRVVVRTEPRASCVRLWVEDNGIGIKPEHQERIFRLFQRLPAASPYEGTGIGLAIVRKAAEKMGGTAGVESDGFTGSRFWIELPAGQER